MIDVALADYVADGIVGLRAGENLFVGWMPDRELPDEPVVMFRTYASSAGLVAGVDPHHPYDTLFVQCQVRGAPFLGDGASDIMSGRDLAEDIYSRLHMLAYFDVVDIGGLENLYQVVGDGPPRFLETDDRSRPLWVNDYTVQIRAKTAHR